jgi:hypothetical protein
MTREGADNALAAFVLKIEPSPRSGGILPRRSCSSSGQLVKANGVIGWKLLQRMAKMLHDAREGG